MKTGMRSELFRIAAAEVFLQLGFERATEQALGIAADLFAYHIEAMAKQIVPLQNNDFHILMDVLVNKFYGEELYQKDELMQFLDQQIQLRRQMKEPLGDPLQTSVSLMPQEISCRNVLQPIGAVSGENHSRAKPPAAAKLDEFLLSFMEDCNTRPGNAFVPKQLPDASKFFDESCVIFMPPLHKREAALFQAQLMDPMKRTFLDDFKEMEKYKVFRT